MIPPPLNARIAHTPLTVGDPLVIQLQGVLPAGARLVDRVARVRDTLPDGVRLLSADTLQVRDGVVVGQVRVAFFRPDSQMVPSFAIATGTDTLVSAAIPVYVRPVLPVADATLRDIHDVDPPVPFTVIVSLLGAALLLTLVWRFFRRGRRAVIPVPSTPAAQPPSAYDAALAGLRDVGAALPVEERYARVADIVRGYIAAAHGVPAMERTTPEILTALGANGSLSGFLGEADRVKFAGLRPEPRAAADYTTRARSVIDALR